MKKLLRILPALAILAALVIGASGGMVLARQLAGTIAPPESPRVIGGAIEIGESSAEPQEAPRWTYSKIESTEVDMAGKTRVMVEITDGADKELIMLKFQSKPDVPTVLAEVGKVLYVRNNPLPKELTIEDYKMLLAEKEALIVEKDAEIASLKSAVGVK